MPVQDHSGGKKNRATDYTGKKKKATHTHLLFPFWGNILAHCCLFAALPDFCSGVWSCKSRHCCSRSILMWFLSSNKKNVLKEIATVEVPSLSQCTGRQWTAESIECYIFLKKNAIHKWMRTDKVLTGQTLCAILVRKTRSQTWHSRQSLMCLEMNAKEQTWLKNWYPF